MRHFKPNLTLRLPADLVPRLNSLAARFPYSNPHALGLYLLSLGLQSAEVAPAVSAPAPASPAKRKAKA